MHPLTARFCRSFLLLGFFVAGFASGKASDFSWRFISPTPTGNSIRQVEFLNGQFVAVGEAGTLLTSVDGTNWTQQTVPATYHLVAVTYANGRYVLSDDRTGLYTSTDAVHWVTAKTARYYYWAGGRTALLAYGNGLFLRLMSYTSATQTVLETSSDGLSWTDLNTTFPTALPSALTFAAGRFIAEANGGIWSSADGASWTKAVTGDTPTSGSLANGNGILVATRENAPCLRSTDGLNWSVASNAPTINKVNFVNGFFFAREASTGACLRSADALTWSTFSAIAEPALLNAAYGNGVYVGQSNAAPAELMRSADGLTWTNLHHDILPLPEPGAQIVHGNGVFLSGGVRSTDGEHWETDTFVRPGSNDNPTQLHFCRDRFIVYQNHAFYVSTDGRTGRKIFTPADPSEEFGLPFFGAGKYVIPSAQGALVSVDGEIWIRDAGLKGTALTHGNGLFVRTTSTTIETSADGVTWELRYSQSSPIGYEYRLGAPLFGNGRFIVGVAWTNSHGHRGNDLLTSADGIRWDWPSNTPRGISGITYANGVFVSQSLPEIAGRADPHGSNPLPSPLFNVSLNGVTWHSYPIPTDRVVVSFAGNNSVFLASTSTDLLATSFPAPTQPVINAFTQPGSTTMTRGNGVILKVEASGSGPLSYQWRIDGSPLPYGTQSSYVATIAGTYDVVVTNAAGSVTSSTVSLTMNDSWLANISSRAYAGIGEDQLIQGFVVRPPVPGREGIAILARAVGPTLTQFGLREVMANPNLELHRHSDRSILARNDNWYSAELALDFRRAGAFALPNDSLDAALKEYLGSGAHSLTITGVNGGQGVVLSELYDLSVYGRLVNLSARARVGTGDRTLIAGFVIAGGKPLKVLIRGVGPTLSTQGIAVPLANPKLTLFDSRGREIHNNDNWNQARNLTELRTATTETGAFVLPENSNDAAMLETLDPGTYTVHVTSVDGSSGVALVEIYEAL